MILPHFLAGRENRWPGLFAGVFCLMLSATSHLGAQAPSKPLTEKMVRESIERGKTFLQQQQGENGAWSDDRYIVGKSSLALMTLINCGMTVDDEPVQRGLNFLRTVREPSMTYDVSLHIMALAAAKDGKKDVSRILSLSNKLAGLQRKDGDGAGGWSYNFGEGRGIDPDRSNSQFAVLGLREAQYANVPVDREVWERVRQFWTSQQSADGGWNYHGKAPPTSTGSMTVAGITTQVIVESMLRDTADENPDGTPNCCGQTVKNESLDRGVKWLERSFAVGHNPGGGGGGTLYYLYGLERAGRLSGRRFFGTHDWYREGADYLIQMQSERDGSWRGNGHGEDEVVSTSLALLFLSKGLAPVLINKLQYASDHPNPKEDDSWNRHRDDIRNLTDLISGLPGWPKLVTWQQLDIGIVSQRGGLQDLMLSPILYISGDRAPQFNPAEINLLRQYVINGGFILGVATCTKTDFDRGFREIVREMYPEGENPFKRLTAEHPVYRSEYLIDPESTELWGVDVGCRTSIMYSPHDLACLWDKWSVVEPPRRSPQMKSMITKSTRVGINVVAYATGREPPSSLPEHQLDNVAAMNDELERGFLQVAKLRHTGGWDAAPRAVRNLLVALNSYAGVTANTKVKNITPLDDSLKNYPLVYMHGRNAFTFNKQEQDKLRTQISRGAMLFADACCAAPQFDKSFRDLMTQMFPDHKLTRIPANHEMFTTKVAHDLRDVRRREPSGGEPGKPYKLNMIVGEPYLEGIEIDGKYVVVYSKYDLSCALERQASAACAGYLTEDAIKIAVNVVMYSILR